MRALALTLLLAGCAYQPTHGPVARDAMVALDPSLNESQVADAQLAVQRWCEDSHGQVCMTTARGTVGEVVVRAHLHEPGLLGLTFLHGSGQALIELSDSNEPGWGDTGIVMHEIGHALGLTHEADTLMQASGYRDPVVDAVTLGRLGRLER